MDSISDDYELNENELTNLLKSLKKDQTLKDRLEKIKNDKKHHDLYDVANDLLSFLNDKTNRKNNVEIEEIWEYKLGKKVMKKTPKIKNSYDQLFELPKLSNDLITGDIRVQQREPITSIDIFSQYLPECTSNRSNNHSRPAERKLKSRKRQTRLTLYHPVLPKENRLIPSLPPPLINEREAVKGLLSLIQRNLLPSSCQIIFEPSPLQNSIMKQTDRRTIDKQKDIGTKIVKSSGFNVNEDISNPTSPERKSNFPNLEKKKRNIHSSTTTSTMIGLAPISRPPPTTPAYTQQEIVFDKYELSVPELELPYFKEIFNKLWILFLKFIEVTENFLRDIGADERYFLSITKVQELLKKVSAANETITYTNILELFENDDVVMKLYFDYYSKEHKDIIEITPNTAAFTIQEQWRNYMKRKTKNTHLDIVNYYSSYIGTSWSTHSKLRKIRLQMKENYEKQLINFRNRQENLKDRWNIITSNRYTVIHLPSLGYSSAIRKRHRIRNFGQTSSIVNPSEQVDLLLNSAHQLSRLCSIYNSKIDIIFISPIRLNKELEEYYDRMMLLIKPDDVEETKHSNRYTIIEPDALGKFQHHNLSLSTLLKYSPKTMKRIKKLASVNNCYIQGSILNEDDVFLSEYFNLPYLGTEPNLTQEIHLTSNVRSIFSKCDVSTAPYEMGITTMQQLYEMLASLIIHNTLIPRWVFRINNDIHLRGLAYCDVISHLQCYTWVLSERKKYGDKWKRRWAHEPAYSKIIMEIPTILQQHLKILDCKIYNTPKKFFGTFLNESDGGIIEAYPPSDSVGYVFSTICIYPDQIRQITSGDIIELEGKDWNTKWGWTSPQNSCEPTKFNKIVERVSEELNERNVFGYIDIYFYTFISFQTQEQVIWGDSVFVGYSTKTSFQQMIKFLTNGTFDPLTHTFQVEEKEEKENSFDGDSKEISEDMQQFLKASKKNRKDKEQKIEFNGYRYISVIPHLFHAGLSLINYRVFFQMCRAQNIGFKLKKSNGSMFILVDSNNRVNYALLNIEEDLFSSLESINRSLKILHGQTLIDIGNEKLQTSLVNRNNFESGMMSIKRLLKDMNSRDTNN
ncbi:hypothetical protein SNEBB_006683 [Seison nebaliae]|nr:hypothetical protein SNEBB_006683 [Seison nebaliae]